MNHLEAHIAQLETKVQDIVKIIADVRAHLQGKTLVAQGMTADDPDTAQVETEASVPPVDAGAQGV